MNHYLDFYQNIPSCFLFDLSSIGVIEKLFDALIRLQRLSFQSSFSFSHFAWEARGLDFFFIATIYSVCSVFRLHGAESNNLGFGERGVGLKQPGKVEIEGEDGKNQE